MNESAGSESAPGGDGMTVQLVGDPDFGDLAIEVRLRPEDLVRVRAYVEQGHDLDAVVVLEPELHERVTVAIAAAIAPPNRWGAADDVLLARWSASRDGDA